MEEVQQGADPGRDLLVCCLCVRCPGPLGACSPVCPLAVFFFLLVRCSGPPGSCLPLCPLGAQCYVCGVLGHLGRVHRCARSVRYFAYAVSWATWPLCTGVPAWCVVLLVRCPGPLGSCSPVCPLGVLCCVCGVLGHLAPVHRRARSVRCLACAVSWATWLLFTGVPARCVVCVCGVLGGLAPVHRCARLVCCVACAVSRATWLLFTGVPARCVTLRMRCPGPLGHCAPVCPLGVWFCLCGVLGHLAPVHRCARLVCCVACASCWATWLLFTGVPARCVALRVRCPGPLGSCSPVCPLGVLSVCAVSWAAWLLFTGVPAWFVVLRVRCPGPLGSCSPLCPPGALLWVCGVPGHLAPVHRCARLVCCVACLVSWATWLLLTGVPARFFFFFACAVFWAIWLLFTPVPARCAVLRARCPGPLGSCSPLCPLGALLCVCGVLDHLALVHRCARSVCDFGCAVSWATWLLFTGVTARCAVLRVRCPGPLSSCSPVCLLGALLCVCGVLGHLASVHRCARSVRFLACAVSWATWRLFTGVPARCLFFYACLVFWATWLLFTAVPAWCAV